MIASSMAEKEKRDIGDALASFEQQCQQYLEHSGGQTACTAGLAHLFQTIGDVARAQRWRVIAAKYGR